MEKGWLSEPRSARQITRSRQQPFTTHAQTQASSRKQGRGECGWAGGRVQVGRCRGRAAAFVARRKRSNKAPGGPFSFLSPFCLLLCLSLFTPQLLPFARLLFPSAHALTRTHRRCVAPFLASS
ncbi:hypothetical protein GQ54DRAFT_199955 [Martensiomyces pterosporus]|nr:hypothetical protein GQ54DRAFT_199955 [Martensiomyces pterosporus]